MVRLKLSFNEAEALRMQDLHSTMVRLKQNTRLRFSRRDNKFTFHYGEIKAAKTRRATSAQTEFTFHYGEIKAVRGIDSQFTESNGVFLSLL